MYHLNEKMESILKNVYNTSKIHGLELMAAQYEYLLYHIYIANATTADQLSEIIYLEKTKLMTALSHMVAKGLIESNKTLYNGETISVYSITPLGIDFVRGFFDFCDYEIKQRSFIKQINHFIEAGSLYFSAFNNAKRIKLTREENHLIGDKSILRPDSELLIEYDEFTEHFFIENDRGTELEGKLIEKLNEKYAIYMLNDNPVNLVFTISRESLLKNKKAKDLSKTMSVRLATEFVKILRATSVVMSKLKLDRIDDLYTCIENYYSVEPDYKTYAIINEHIGSLIAFKRLNESLMLETKDDVYSRMYFEDDVRKRTLDQEKELFLKRNTDYRVETIRNIVVKMGEQHEVSESLFKTYSEILKNHLTNDLDKMKIPSYKALLLTNELIVGPLLDVKRYFSKRTKNLQSSKVYFEDVFNIKFDKFEYSTIEFTVGDTIIKKNLNSCIGYVNSKRIALSILEPSLNLSDKIKLDLIKYNNVKHSYDALRFVILGKERSIDDVFIDYDDVVLDALEF